MHNILRPQFTMYDDLHYITLLAFITHSYPERLTLLTIQIYIRICTETNQNKYLTQGCNDSAPSGN